LSKKASKELLSQDEIRAVYRQGEEAVVTLVTMLIERIEKLEMEVEELKGKLNKNSRNSSKPPSSDGFKKRTKSLRRKSEKKSGGQPQHPGSTLEWSDNVDGVEEHCVSECSGCGASLEAEPVKEYLLRQVFDIPPIELEVTEHQSEVKCCPDCGQQNQGVFPPEVSNVVQYGPRLKGMMVYLMEGQLLPSARTVETLSDILGVQISE
jgi:transposase